MEYRLMDTRSHHIFANDDEVKNSIVKTENLLVIKYYSFRDYFEFKYWFEQNKNKLGNNECFEIDNLIFHGSEKVIRHYEGN